MEKICIVRRRRIGLQTEAISRIESGSRMEALPRIESGSRIETISRIEAVSRIESIRPAASESQAASHVLSIELTPEQIDRIRANNQFQELYGASQAPIFLNLHLENAFSVRMLKTAQICDMLQISKSTLTRLIQKGSIRSHRIGRSRRFATQDVMDFLSAEMPVGSLGGVRSKNVLTGSQAKQEAGL